MNIIIDFSKTHKKIVVFASVLISLGVICGIVIYTTGVQDKKEKELLSRIDNLEEQIKKEDELSEDIESDAVIMDSEEETSTDNDKIDDSESDTSQETTQGNSNNNPSNNNANTVPSNNTTSTNAGTGSGIQTNVGSSPNDNSVEGTTDESVEKISDNVNTGYSGANQYYAYDVTLLSQRNNCSDYVITNANYSDNEVYLNNDQFDKIEGTLSVTVRCISDTTNIIVKYVIKDSSGSVITDGKYETLTAQSSGKGSVCTLTGTVYFPLTQGQGRYTIEFIE